MRHIVPIAEQVRAARAELDRRCGSLAVGDGYTYIIRQEGGDLMKIGKAISPEHRIADIQRMNGAPLELVALVHGQGCEGDLHRRHAGVREHGEWFRVTGTPIPEHNESWCWGCSLSPDADDVRDFLEVVAECPVVAVGDLGVDVARFATRQGQPIWGLRSAELRSACNLAYAAKRGEFMPAVRAMFIKGCAKSGRYDGAAARFLRRLRGVADMEYGSNQAVYFWPGMDPGCGSTPAEVVAAFRAAADALSELTIVVHEHWWQREAA